MDLQYEKQRLDDLERNLHNQSDIMYDQMRAAADRGDVASTQYAQDKLEQLRNQIFDVQDRKRALESKTGGAD
jgi:hypothetical protein